METIIRMTSQQKNKIYEHIYPGDGCEAVSFLICGRHTDDNIEILLGKEVHHVPYEECSKRTPNEVVWETSCIEGLLDRLLEEDLALIKFHSHPTGFPNFSEIDDRSDIDVFEAVFSWSLSDRPHASIVLLPNKKMVARGINTSLDFIPVNKLSVIGDDIEFYYKGSHFDLHREANLRNKQTFGKGTLSALSNMKVGIVGCSGTGSIIAELLSRKSIGHLILVDPEKVEKKNLNRILNTVAKDAREKRLKVDVLKEMIEKMGFGTIVDAFPTKVNNPETILALANCDVLFGCVDSVLGRHYLNRISTFYNIPYFDIGVGLEADSENGINAISGSIHYLQPGESLLSRSVYSPEDLREEQLRLNDPEGYKDELRRGYISGAKEDNPAVMSVNMTYSSVGVNEFLSRIHPFKPYSNSKYNALYLSLSEVEFDKLSYPEKDEHLKEFIGMGEVKPLLKSY